MTALEKIDREADHLRVNVINHYVAEVNKPYAHESVNYLLKAFRVMREIAMRNRQDALVTIKDDNIRVPLWAYLESEIDHQFEDRMKGE